VLVLFQDDDAGAFSKNESIAVLVEGAAGGFGGV